MDKAEVKKIQVSITDTDKFKNILDVLLFMCMDERIDKGIRQEYLDQIVKDILKEEK